MDKYLTDRKNKRDKLAWNYLMVFSSFLHQVESDYENCIDEELEDFISQMKEIKNEFVINCIKLNNINYLHSDLEDVYDKIQELMDQIEIVGDEMSLYIGE